MSVRFDYRETAEQLLDRKVLVLLRLILEQINLLRTNPTRVYPAITEAQAIARFKEILRQ